MENLETLAIFVSSKMLHAMQRWDNVRPSYNQKHVVQRYKTNEIWLYIAATLEVPKMLT